jgi:hypothetical protein
LLSLFSSADYRLAPWFSISPWSLLLFNRRRWHVLETTISYALLLELKDRSRALRSFFVIFMNMGSLRAIEASSDLLLLDLLLFLSIVHVILDIEDLIVKIWCIAFGLERDGSCFSQDYGRLSAREFEGLDRLIGSWQQDAT